jgi:hypothetical protein
MAKKKKLVTGSWSKDEIRQLKKLFPNGKTQEVADQLGRESKSVLNKAHKMGIRKSKKYLKSRSRA